MNDRNILLVSNYNAVPRPWNGVSFEFFDVISRIETARIVAPPAHNPDIGPGADLPEVLRYAVRELDTRLRRLAGRRPLEECSQSRSKQITISAYTCVSSHATCPISSK